MRTEDGSIIHRCLNGKPGAFGMLVDKYKEGVYAYVYNELRNLQDAQDVTQEVFLQAYRDLRSLRKWESFSFWLHRIAYRRCMDFLRIKSRRADGEFIEDQHPKVVDAPSLDSYRRSQLNESVWEALDSLPEIYREVLMLHYFGGMTIKDIAIAVGASPSAIKKRLSRARAQLREEMIAMMDTAFEGQRLPAGFTFRVVEAVKRIKINPVPRVAGFPWGLPLAAGIIVTVLVFNPHLSFLNPMSVPTGSPPSAETKVLKTGEIPVDILDISTTQIISSNQSDGDMGGPELPDPQNALLMAPQAEGGKWTEKAEKPMATMGAYSAVVGGRIYVIGGSNNNRESFTAVEEYDPAMDTWEIKADMPDGRGMGSASAVNGKIYVIGGWRSLIAGNPVWTVEEYDPATDTWKRKADMPTARGVLSTSVVNGKVYSIGGTPNTFLEAKVAWPVLGTVEEYDTEVAPPTQGKPVEATGKTFAPWGSIRSD
jgi:RNA polymerase sigma factor (sigma-70 family)